MTDTTVPGPIDPPLDRRDPLEPAASLPPGRGIRGRIRRSDAWRSVFRHPPLDTPRGRALQSFSNFFLHLYPVKIPARVLRLRYSFRLGFIAAVLFGILTVTGIGLMFFYTPAIGSAYGNLQQLKSGVGHRRTPRTSVPGIAQTSRHARVAMTRAPRASPRSRSLSTASADWSRSPKSSPLSRARPQRGPPARPPRSMPRSSAGSSRVGSAIPQSARSAA